MEEGRSAFKILSGKLTGERALGRPWRKWEDNIRMDFKEIYISMSSWVDSAQDRDYWRGLLFYITLHHISIMSIYSLTFK